MSKTYTEGTEVAQSSTEDFFNSPGFPKIICYMNHEVIHNQQTATKDTNIFTKGTQGTEVFQPDFSDFLSTMKCYKKKKRHRMMSFLC